MPDSRFRSSVVPIRFATPTRGRGGAARGLLATEPVQGLPALSIPRPGHLEEESSRTLYDGFRTLGLDLGPSFQTVRRIWRAQDQLWAELVAPRAISPELDQYWLHPALLDGCFQLVVGHLASCEQRLTALYLPLGIEHLERFRRPRARFTCHVHMRGSEQADSSVLTADLFLSDDQGALAEIHGFSVKRAERSTFRRSARAELEPWLHTIAWKAVEPPTRKSCAARWLLVADDGQFATQLAERLANAGQPSRVVAPRESRDGWRNVLREASPSITGIVWLASLNTRGTASPVELEATLLPTVSLTQALADRSDQSPLRLCVVTRGAADVEPSAMPLDLAAAALRGFLRTVPHEIPSIQASTVDLDPRSAERGVEALANELLSEEPETSVAYRGSRRYVARLASARHRAALEPHLERPAGGSQLIIRRRGSLDELQLKPIPVEPLGHGEVRIDVESAGLNFRDVLNALGLYPGQPGDLGMESAGRIAEVGPEVTNLKVGDEVMALCQGSLATSAITDAKLVCHRPRNLSAAEASACPVVFSTAAFALQHLAQLKPGERVLVHVAAGGVGWAVMQLAARIGAEVFATASRDKWAYLRDLGVKHIYDSRSLTFAEQILVDTAGRGVDVVVNSLAGEFIPASLSTLSSQGRFVEIGKQGIWSAEQVRQSRRTSHTIRLPSIN